MLTVEKLSKLHVTRIYISMYPIRAIPWPISFIKGYFNTIRKNYYWWGNKYWGYGFGEWRFFWWRSMWMYVHLRILRIYIPVNFSQTNFSLVTPLPPPHPWKIFARNYHYYLKEYLVILCFKSAEVVTFVKISQNEVLSEERQWNGWEYFR